MKFSHKTYEKLIDLVRERPALYNYQLTEYKDHQLQKNIIAQEHVNNTLCIFLRPVPTLSQDDRTRHILFFYSK